MEGRERGRRGDGRDRGEQREGKRKQGSEGGEGGCLIRFGVLGKILLLWVDGKGRVLDTSLDSGGLTLLP